MFDTQRHTSTKIINKMVRFRIGESHQKRNYLIWLTDKDYENALVGNGKEIYVFVRDCLADEGLMSKSWGKKK